MRGFVAMGVGLLAAAVAAAAEAQSTRLFSYDPASAEARSLLGGVTLEVKPAFMRMRAQRLMATMGHAVAELDEPGDDPTVSPNALERLIGPGGGDSAVYGLKPGEHADALVRALCRGSDRAWMTTTAIRRGRGLTLRFIGRDASTGEGWVCATLEYRWRGEWALPGRSHSPHDGPQVYIPRG
jgi:hypothetical protein